MIPVVRPDIGEEEIAEVTEILRGGMLAQGPKVAELEARWAEYVGVRHAIAVTNGTVALMIIYAGMGLGPGDEVITVSHSFNATASAVLSTGATPVFVDIEPDTYVLGPDRIEAAITPRTKAICPVHLFGLPANMAAISPAGLIRIITSCRGSSARNARRAAALRRGSRSASGSAVARSASFSAPKAIRGTACKNRWQGRVRPAVSAGKCRVCRGK